MLNHVNLYLYLVNFSSNSLTWHLVKNPMIFCEMFRLRLEKIHHISCNKTYFKHIPPLVVCKITGWLICAASLQRNVRFRLQIWLVYALNSLTHGYSAFKMLPRGTSAIKMLHNLAIWAWSHSFFFLSVSCRVCNGSWKEKRFQPVSGLFRTIAALLSIVVRPVLPYRRFVVVYHSEAAQQHSTAASCSCPASNRLSNCFFQQFDELNFVCRWCTVSNSCSSAWPDCPKQVRFAPPPTRVKVKARLVGLASTMTAVYTHFSSNSRTKVNLTSFSTKYTVLGGADGTTSHVLRKFCVSFSEVLIVNSIQWKLFAPLPTRVWKVGENIRF